MFSHPLNEPFASTSGATPVSCCTPVFLQLARTDKTKQRLHSIHIHVFTLLEGHRIDSPTHSEREGVFSGLQSATSALDAIQSYTLVL